MGGTRQHNTCSSTCVTYYVYAAHCPHAGAVAPAAQQQPWEMCMSPKQLDASAGGVGDVATMQQPVRNAQPGPAAHLCMHAVVARAAADAALPQQQHTTHTPHPTRQSRPRTCAGHLSAAKRGAKPAAPLPPNRQSKQSSLAAVQKQSPPPTSTGHRRHAVLCTLQQHLRPQTDKPVMTHTHTHTHKETQCRPLHVCK